ncbi:conserved hypothetical protein [Culex quinquefasciatus]|uniref:Uncharacterized protein n=1 Tax=Culex quinquefasciatus TaxID=7176 RepID=B0XBL0_CULQU|nr:conserved hypothetical protein [Culex quinquefasciatus]|eukprot:XP_001867032.1 conserved hypothetical protein [Culex quinquefasciatus]
MKSPDYIPEPKRPRISREGQSNQDSVDVFTEHVGHSERLAILVSWDGKEKLLGTATLEQATGEAASNAVHKRLEEWRCTPLVRGLCFDTTSVNTGRLNGACVNLERMLGRDLMWLACRHHVLELILAKAFCVCFGPTKSPETPLFKRFREKWPEISKDKVKSLTVTKKFKEQKESVVGFLKTSTEWSRNDYKELNDLTLLVLGNRPESFT